MSEGAKLVNIDFTMAIQIINFLVLVYFFWRVFSKKIGKVLEDRKHLALSEMEIVEEEKEKLDEELIKQLNLIKNILGPCFSYKEFENFITFKEITCIYDILDVEDGILDIFFLNENMDLGIVSLDKELLTMSEKELRQIKENA